MWRSPVLEWALPCSLEAADLAALLKLVRYSRPQRVLLIGLLDGALVANLTDWTTDGTLIEVLTVVSTATDALFIADHFGKAAKVVFRNASAEHVDWSQLDEYDFILCVTADVVSCFQISQQAYARLAANGWLCWLGFTTQSHVMQALADAAFPDQVNHVAGTTLAYLHKHPATPPTFRGLTLRWEGDLDVQHSLAVVNRGLVERLRRRGHTIHAEQPHAVPASPYTQRHGALIASEQPLSRKPDVIVRHAWPPDLRPTPRVPVVLIQPWEYGAVPRAWVEAVQQGDIAEWWVPSRGLRTAAVNAGVPPERIAVVPNGVDVSVFRPDGPVYPLRTTKRFRFLYVGGTIWRKGFDLLLRAFADAFTAADDVCLVVKDVGVGQFYKGQTAEAVLSDWHLRRDAPAIEYLTDNLRDDELAALYRACQCLVLPYRGEGFGLPVAEAMACGVPCLVTQGGPTDDWCTPHNAYFLPAQRVPIAESPAGLPTAGIPWVWEVDPTAFVEQLRAIAANTTQAATKGRYACADIRGRLTWDHAARIAESRLQALAARPTVSLMMIVKNEEAHLAECLATVHDLVDEIIVVDTGSSDTTKAIATRFGAKVYDFAWEDSFAAARNVALDHATSTYVLWMDADDRLDARARAQLRSLFARLTPTHSAYVMQCLCLREPGRPASVVDQVRLFRRHADLRWCYRVHEQILPSLRTTAAVLHRVDVTITHVGYCEPAERTRKLERDARLLELERTEQPDDPFTLFNCGHVAFEQGDYPKALVDLQRSLVRSQPSDNIVRKIYVLLAQCQHALGHPETALETLATGRALYPNDAELLFCTAQLSAELGAYLQAEKYYRQLLASRDDPHLASTTNGLRGATTRCQLAQVYVHLGRLNEAMAEYAAVSPSEPEYGDAQRQLQILRATP